jgi:glutamate dehydrogenase/leucine dehydrogenase
LVAYKAAGGLAEYPDAKPLDKRDDLLTLDCDILVPAAQPDAVHADNVDAVQARVVIPGANIPATRQIEAQLAARGVLFIPDFIANAGGVICAAVEWRGGSRTEAFATIEDRIRTNTLELLEHMDATGTLPRTAAEAMARSRLARAKAYRRVF